MDDLDRFHAALIAAATRGDWQTVSDDVAMLLATIRQLRRELDEARAELAAALRLTHLSQRHDIVFCKPAHNVCGALEDGRVCGLRTYAGHAYCPKHQLRYERQGDPAAIGKRGPKPRGRGSV